MRILINPTYFEKKEYQALIDKLPHVTFTDDIHDKTIDGMITWAHAAKKDVLDKYPRLKLLLLPSAGYDKADLDYLKQRQIIMTNARGIYDIQIAEDVIAKILYLNRHIKFAQENQQKQTWNRHGIFHEIYGSTVGIIGAGSIGRRIAKVIKGFDTHVLGYRREASGLPEFDEILTGKKGLHALLSRSDYVILSVPLTKHTHHLMNETTLKEMKSSALLINIARGHIVDQQALIKALEHGWIRGAALDVTETEPLPADDPLWNVPHVFISPHTAGSSVNARKRVIFLLEKIIRQYLNNEVIDNRIC